MESRKITIVSSKTQKKSVIDSAATTLAELKADLRAANIDYTDCTFYEGLSKIELNNDNAVLPHDVPYKGQITNNLVFMLSAAKKKVKSGSYRTDLYNTIKANNLGETIKKKFGKNYTNLPTDILAKVVDKGLIAPVDPDSKPKVKPAKKEVPAKKAINTENTSEYVTKAELAEILKDYVKKPKDNIEDSPYSSDEIDDLFEDM